MFTPYLYIYSPVYNSRKTYNGLSLLVVQNTQNFMYFGVFLEKNISRMKSMLELTLLEYYGMVVQRTSLYLFQYMD